jgi:hypothetical protein
MSKKVSFIIMFLSVIVFLSIKADLVWAQELNVALPDLTGAPGEQVVVTISLADNDVAVQQAVQSGINITFNPDVVFIQDISDVTEGPALEGMEENFLFIPGLKALTDEPPHPPLDPPEHTMGVYIGIFPKVFPPPIIPDGVVATVTFTINNEAKTDDSTSLIFSLRTFNTTNFSNANGEALTSPRSTAAQFTVTNGSITVAGGAGGGSSCAMASGSVHDSGVIATLFLALIAGIVIGLKRLKRMGSKN